jgi:hypothetical protein
LFILHNSADPEAKLLPYSRSITNAVFLDCVSNHGYSRKRKRKGEFSKWQAKGIPISPKHSVFSFLKLYQTILREILRQQIPGFSPMV